MLVLTLAGLFRPKYIAGDSRREVNLKGCPHRPVWFIRCIFLRNCLETAGVLCLMCVSASEYRLMKHHDYCGGNADYAHLASSKFHVLPRHGPYVGNVV